MSDWMNPYQRDYVDSLSRKKRSELCPCGWYAEKECVVRCATGTRTSAQSLLRRVQDIYRQVDKNAATQADRIAALEAENAALEAKLAQALVKARSDAINDFCAKAGITMSVEVAALPDDVRNFRRNSAIAQITGEGDKVWADIRLRSQLMAPDIMQFQPRPTQKEPESDE